MGGLLATLSDAVGLDPHQQAVLRELLPAPLQRYDRATVTEWREPGVCGVGTAPALYSAGTGVYTVALEKEDPVFGDVQAAEWHYDSGCHTVNR